MTEFIKYLEYELFYFSMNANILSSISQKVEMLYLSLV